MVSAGLRGRVDVLLVSPTSSGVGGVAWHVSRLSEKLAEAGYRVSVISSENTPIVNIKGLKNPSFMVTSFFSAAFRDASVVHAHSVPSMFAMKAASSRRKVLTIHGVYSQQVNLLHGSLVSKVASYLEKVSLKWADVVTVVSERAVHAYREMGVDVVHIPNAVDVFHHDVEKIRLGSRQVVYVGRLSKEKNVDAVLEAAEKIGEAVFVIVGDGPERGFLEKKAKGLRNVVFTGAVDHRKALGYIAGSDVLVLPSIVEGLSTVVLEAMALKTPVIATAVGGNLELIENGETGLLIQPREVSQLVEAVNKLLDDKAYSARVTENAYRKVLTKYSWDVVFPQYLRVYGFG